MAWTTCNVRPSTAAWVEFTKNLISNLRLNLLFSPKFGLKQARGKKALALFQLEFKTFLSHFKPLLSLLNPF